MSNPISSESLVPPRVFSFAGGCNFRDIGGYATADGRTVRWGQVYRSGVLAYFSADDHAPLDRLGVRAICDLRFEGERQDEPTRWPSESTQALFWEDGDDTPTLGKFAARHPNTAAGMRNAMLDIYRAFPEWMAGRIQGLFQCVKTGALPLVVHCSAGKDRTGVACALLLSALGVPEETIFKDYLLTNEAIDLAEFFRQKHAARLGLGDENHALLSTPKDILEVMIRAEEDYLRAAFEVIDGTYGGAEQYLVRAAGLSTADLEQVRRVMLTD